LSRDRKDSGYENSAFIEADEDLADVNNGEIRATIPEDAGCDSGANGKRVRRSGVGFSVDTIESSNDLRDSEDNAMTNRDEKFSVGDGHKDKPNQPHGILKYSSSDTPRNQGIKSSQRKEEVTHSPSKDEVTAHLPSKSLVAHSPSKDMVGHSPSKYMVAHSASLNGATHSTTAEENTNEDDEDTGL
jgi:hypothetical protein